MSTRKSNSRGQARREANNGGRQNGRVHGKPRAQHRKPQAKKSIDDSIRLNKYIANSGVCSRREADTYIAAGLVHVNNKPVTEMGFRVKPGDQVTFDGRAINPEPPTYVLLNKPKGFVTTTSTNKSDTVMDLVSNATTARVTPIGRLGRNAMGLILLTNDDDLKEKLSKRGLNRLFHIELDKNLKREDLKAIEEGLSIKGNEIQVEEISYVDGKPRKEIGIRIKHMGTSVLREIFEFLDYKVVRIDCVMIGHLTKKDMPRGQWRILGKTDIDPFHMY